MTPEEKEKIIRQHMSELGKAGGKRTAELHGHDHFVSIGKKGGRPKKVKA